MVMPLVLVLLAAPAAQHDNVPPPAEILARVGDYVRRFETDFAIIISDERYDQRDVVFADGRMRSRMERAIRSETLLAWVPEQQSWLTARNVLSVAGAAVNDSKVRLDAALAENTPDTRARLRRLRDEGARFNVGRIYRNFNDPTLVMQYLDPAYQPRFAFTVLGADRIGGVEAWKIAFAERSRPTLIQTPTVDLLSTGTIWVGRADGSVVRTMLTVMDALSNTTAQIDVDYRLDSKLGIRVPARMSESYEQQALENVAPAGAPQRLITRRERIECVATYSNYRRFETSGRLVSPQ
jgi:hypothetical protein